MCVLGLFGGMPTGWGYTHPPGRRVDLASGGFCHRKMNLILFWAKRCDFSEKICFQATQISKIRTECIIQKSHCIHGENKECWGKTHIQDTQISKIRRECIIQKSHFASMVKIKSVGQYGNKYPRESLGKYIYTRKNISEYSPRYLLTQSAQ